MKPCVFCGGEARWGVTRKNGVPTGERGYECEVYCCNCKKGVKNWAFRKSWAMKSAFDAWNNRE